MTRMSAIVLLAAVALTPALSFAQGAASPPGTNSADTAQSSGGLRPGKNEGGGGLGTGRAKQPATPSADAVIQQENTLLQRKLNSICRGC